MSFSCLVIVLFFAASAFGSGDPPQSDSLRIVELKKRGSILLTTYPDSTIIYFNEALKLAEKTNNTDLILNLHSSLGGLHGQLGHVESAIYHFKQSFAIASKARKAQAISGSCINLGNCFVFKGNYAQAIDYHLKAIRILEKELKDTLYTGTSYYCIGAAYYDWENYPQSLRYFRKALALMRTDKDQASILNCYLGIGSVCNEMGRYGEALSNLNKAEQLLQKLPQAYQKGYLLAAKGETYLLKNQAEKALPLLSEAIPLLTQIRDPKALAEANLHLGKAYLQLKQYKSARSYLDKALAMARDQQTPKLRMEVFEAHYQLEKATGHPDKALKMQEKYIQLKDSLFSETTGKQIAEMQERYESEKKQKEISRLVETGKKKELELSGQKNIRNILIFMVIILLLVATLVWFILKQRRQKERYEAGQQLFRERSRISRELHDNIGSQLTYIISGMETAEMRLQREKNESKVGEHLDDLATYARSTMQQLRETVWVMNRDTITHKELKDRMEYWLRQYFTGKSTAWELNWDISEELTVPPLLSLNLFRVMQEAANNCIKYGEAALFAVSGESAGPGKIAVCFLDNGVGFDPENVKPGSGMGNMRFRVEEAGGTLTCKSAPGKGTSIILLLPQEG